MSTGQRYHRYRHSTKRTDSTPMNHYRTLPLSPIHVAWSPPKRQELVIPRFHAVQLNRPTPDFRLTSTRHFFLLFPFQDLDGPITTILLCTLKITTPPKALCTLENFPWLFILHIVRALPDNPRFPTSPDPDAFGAKSEQSKTNRTTVSTACFISDYDCLTPLHVQERTAGIKSSYQAKRKVRARVKTDRHKDGRHRALETTRSRKNDPSPSSPASRSADDAATYYKLANTTTTNHQHCFLITTLHLLVFFLSSRAPLHILQIQIVGNPGQLGS
ncbi:hypothetical protein V8F06_001855 [Rhypophila decipiens]